MRKMIKKIVLILIVSLFSISVAYASNINQLDIPHDFLGKKGEGKFFMPKAYDNPRFLIEGYNGSEPNFKNSSLYSFWSSGEKKFTFFQIIK